MIRRGLGVLLIAVLAGGGVGTIFPSSPAAAGITISLDPVGDILALLRLMLQDEVLVIKGHSKETAERETLAYPLEDTIAAIACTKRLANLTITSVRSLDDDVQTAVSAWERLARSPRNEILHALHGELSHLSHEQIQIVWGPELAPTHQDWEDLQDWGIQSASVALAAQRDSLRTAEHRFSGKYEQLTLQTRDPGDAERESAVLLAEDGELVLSANEARRKRLVLEQLDEADELHDIRIEEGFAQGVYSAMTGDD